MRSPRETRQPAAPQARGSNLKEYHYIRVRKQIAEWRRMGASRKVLSWIRDGVRVQWAKGPPAPFHHGTSRFTPPQQAWLAEELGRCLGTGAWRYTNRATHVLKAFIVEHNNKLRLVFNLRHINEHCRKYAVRYEPLSAMRRDSAKYDWMWSIDLTDAYHHIGLRTRTTCITSRSNWRFTAWFTDSVPRRSILGGRTLQQYLRSVAGCRQGFYEREAQLQNMVFYWDYDDRIKPSTL